jgi:class 3 adenylate cyclase
MRLDLVHRTLVGVDIEQYSRRYNPGHAELRRALREVLADACEAVRVSPSEAQDQGDAILSLFGPDIPKPTLIDGLVREIDNGLRAYNRDRVADSHMRVRVAIHAGEVHIDGQGFPGRATVAAMRLLDAQQARQALADSPGNLVVIVSQQIYEDVVVHGSVSLHI